MLKIAHLTKTFGEKKAVDDLSLEIAPGEIYGFIGHNGAGKTTTLKSVVGIQQFDAGEITIGGISIQQRAPGLQAAAGVHSGQSRPVRLHDRHQVSQLHRRHLRRAAPATDGSASGTMPTCSS